MKKEKKILINFSLYVLLFLLLIFYGISHIHADSITTQDVTWYYRNMTNESTMNNTVKTIDTYVNLVSNSSSNQEYLNGYTTRVSNTFTKDFQYNINYTLRILYNSTNDGNFRSDTIERLKNYAYVDSDFTLINSTINQIKYSCEAGICTRIFSINISAKAKVNTNAIRFGVYTTNNISLGFYNHYIGNGDVSSIRMILSETTNITENSNSVIIGQNETIINQNNQSIEQSQQNTQDIIDNSNSNTQAIIDSNKVCNTIDKNDIVINKKYLYSDGTESNNNGYGITDYLSVSNVELKVLNKLNSSGAYWCTYNNKKELISCNTSASLSNNQVLSFDSSVYYVRFSIRTSDDLPTLEYCENGQQANNKTSKGILGKLGDLLDYFNPTSENWFVRKLVDLLIDGLKSLFIPNQEELNTLINNFKSTMETKLGAIYQVADLLVSVLRSILSPASSNSCITFPEIKDPMFDKLLISQTDYCFDSLRTDFGFVFTLSDMIISIVCTLAFANMLYKKYEAFIGGNSSDY